MSSIKRVLSGTAEWDSTNGIATDITVLSSRFSLLRELKTTNKARYFLAYDRTRTDLQPVMLGVFAGNTTDEPGELLAFLVEAHTAASLSHKNIVASTKPEQIEGVHFYVSQYPADTETLRNLLNQKGWFEVELFLKIAVQLAAALHYAQQIKVLHLKLQPEYVLIDKEHKVTLTGFGTPDNPTRQWAHQKRSQECPLAYRSPEQLARENLDGRSDLYALGVLLYEMLTDLLPFQAQDEKQLQKKIALQKVPAIHLIRPDIPESISAMVAKLLAANPAERFQDAAALRYALAQLVDALSQADQSQTEKQSEEEKEKSLSEERQSPADEVQNKDESGPGALYAAEEVKANPPVVRQSEKLVNEPDWLHKKQPEQSVVTQTFAGQHNQPESQPPRVFAGWKDRAVWNRHNALPVILFALGVVMITTISVLAYRGYFENIFKSATTGQSGLNSESSITAQSEAATALQSGSESVKEQSVAAPETTQEPVSEAKSNATDGQPSDNNKVTEPAIPVRAAVSQPRKPDAARLREPSRQANKAKATKHQTNKSSSKARTGRPKPRKGFSKLRFW